MASVSFVSDGDFSKTTRFLNTLMHKDYRNVLEKYGKIGVEALYEATPKRSGKTAESWSYIIEDNGKESTITFTNSNVVKGENVAILIQYGHGTRNGGYVIGRDYINPALQPLFDTIADEAWAEVEKL